MNNQFLKHTIMKKLLTILMLCGVCYGYAQNTPRYAASTKTWKFGGLTWSDAIRIPECNKTSFADSETVPQCRSYTDGTNTWYYYNWPYVHTNAATLCPDPWRVPTKDDFEALKTALKAATTVAHLADGWGSGGYANDRNITSTSYAYYWSTTEDGAGGVFYLRYNGRRQSVLLNSKHRGLQVRCVK
jgi:hypothetical protein